jgi:hypothetical protein
MLRSQLEADAKQLAEIQSRLQKETSERQRLAEAFDATQRALRDQSQSRELDVSKLESRLQLEEVERKRLETQVVQLRGVSLESARTGRVVRKTLRRQLRQPVDEMCQSARRLIQSNLDDEQNNWFKPFLKTPCWCSPTCRTRLASDILPGVPRVNHSKPSRASAETRRGNQFAGYSQNKLRLKHIARFRRAVHQTLLHHLGCLFLITGHAHKLKATVRS